MGRPAHQRSQPHCPGWQVIHCIENGLPLLIENLPEEIDPVLDSVIQVGCERAPARPPWHQHAHPACPTL